VDAVLRHDASYADDVNFLFRHDTVCPSKNETTRMRLFCSSFPMSFSGRSQVRSNSCESI
jgi:hypothetical protein